MSTIWIFLYAKHATRPKPTGLIAPQDIINYIIRYRYIHVGFS